MKGKPMKMIVETPEAEVWTVDRYSNDKVELMTHARNMVSTEAGFAMRLIERWGLVMAVPDGEDSGGRQKGALMPPDQIVSRAFETAKLTFAAVRDGGHITRLPSYAELTKNGSAKELE